MEWAEYNRRTLVQHHIYATGTTDGLIERTFDMPVIRLQSSPLGGDQQIGAKIAESEIDLARPPHQRR